ncbi:MAG: hypothetical protein SchgKO_08410 [Schleiferiaceae bacterium]
MKKVLLILFTAFFLAPLSSEAQFYYGLYQTYGKNRVQYNKFKWNYYRFDRYDVYYYKNGKVVAEKASELVHKNLGQLERYLDARLSDRIQVLVFNSLTDLKQSNVNLNTDEAYNTGGVTHLVGSKMFVYYDGDYAHLEQQIRSGLTDLILQSQIYGGFTESIKNSTLLNLPSWFMEGAISYISNPWTTEMDQYVRDGIATGKYHRLNVLTGDDAVYAGHAIWRYIAQTYGTPVVKNVIYMTVINRSIDDGFLYVLGVDLEELIEGWENYYKQIYAPAFQLQDQLPGEQVVKGHKNQKFGQLKISDDGRYVAYNTNKLGEYKVYVYDTQRDRRKRIIKGGYKISQNTDYSFPVLAWNPNNTILAIVTEEKGFLWLYFYNVEEKKLDKKSLFGFEKVLSMSYSSDGKRMVMSAVKAGRSDIYEYTLLSTTIKPLTQDEWDDHNPSYVKGDRQIVFTSNRLHDTIKYDDQTMEFSPFHDLFIMRDIEEIKKKDKSKRMLWRLTNTPYVHETFPQEYEQGYIQYLSDDVGTRNQYLIGIDSSVAYVDTITHYDYHFNKFQVTQSSLNVTQMASSFEGDNQVSLLYKDKRFRLYLEEKLPAEELDLIPLDGARRPNSPAESIDVSIDELEVMESHRDEYEINIEQYDFDPDILAKYKFISKKELEVAKKEEEKKGTNLNASGNKPADNLASVAKEKPFELPGSRVYFPTFYRDQVGIQIGFVFDNPTYQPYTGSPQPGLLNPGFNAVFKLGIVDLFNNYTLVGGFRTDFQPIAGLSLSPNSEVMIQLVNNKYRLDKMLTYLRRSQVNYEGIYFMRYITNEAHYKISWPFNPVASIRFSAGARHERAITLSDGQFNALEREDRINAYGILKAEYVYDNTIKKGINLYNGWRWKVFTEFYENFNVSPSGMWTAGIDARHYQPLWREMIWANRFAYGTTFGQEKLLYFLGGVDNQVNPSFRNNTPIAQDENYIFQTVVTNLRGFTQNTRNGTSFAVINSEIRAPIFRMMFNRPIQSDFLNTFQIIGFGDVGTAWNGATPYAPENALNNEIIDNGPIKIIVDKQKDPIVGGYGFGLRSRVLGYFLRADWAWGIEDGVQLPRVFYFSLSTDF